MPERRLKKNHLRLNRGLNTESNEISFPDGFTVDEQNYELLVDGSRRRRKALALETGGSTKTVATITSSQVQTSFKWRGVDGDPDKNFVVHQVGNILYFTDDAEIISTTYNATTIDLTAHIVDSSTTDATVANNVCQFSFGRGHLFVTHKYLKPFYIEYNATTDTFTTNVIQILVRDFDGIDDGVGVDTEPLTTLTNDHKYNLRNRGFKQDDIDQYFTDVSKYPAKNALWYRGYRRQTDVTYSDLDGIQIWNSAKLDGEAFGNASAPQGSLFLDPLDTTFAVSTSGGGLSVAITADGTFTTGGGINGGTITLFVTAHGRVATDQITISGNSWEYQAGGDNIDFDYNGVYTLNADGDIPNATGEAMRTTGNLTNAIDIFIPSIDPQFGSFTTTDPDGQIDGGDSLAKSDGEALTVGPKAVGFFAGRVWYAGIEASEWADTIFFSKIAQRAIAYGLCHQELDPTDQDLNSLSSSDGGTIVIPNLGRVHRFIPTRDSILVFSDQGVWEIGGGQRGVFTATGYSVRKVTDAECSSDRSPILIGTGAVYTGPRGIHQIAPNEFTSVLEETNISEQLIQTLWNEIPTVNQQVVQTIHDDALGRIYFLYGDSGLSGSSHNINQYANALVLDLKVGAYYKYVFDVGTAAGILTAYAITDSDSSDSNKKIKWSCETSTTVITTCDLDQTAYVDFGGSESPLPFFETGWDNLGDFQARRQVPVITVYAKRTETGYTLTGNGFDPDNESSNLLTARWDWTDDSVSGKIGSQNETYRHVRGFVPSGTTDVDGYPVVVTRNKIRGRGRVLQLRFDGAATKDSHILGFTTNYKISRST